MADAASVSSDAGCIRHGEHVCCNSSPETVFAGSFPMSSFDHSSMHRSASSIRRATMSVMDRPAINTD